MISIPLLTTTLLLLSLLLIFPSSLLAVSSSSVSIIKNHVTILETASPSELRQRLPRGFSHALLSAPTLVINKKKSSSSNNNKNYNEVLLFAVSQRGIAYLFSMNKEEDSSTRQYELKSQLQLSAPCRSDPIIVVESDKTSSSVILSLQDGSLVKLTVLSSPPELKIAWQQKTGAKSWGFTPVLIENTNFLFAGYRDDHVTAYDISPENRGKILGKVEKSDGVWNAPSYFIDDDDDDPKRRIARLYIARTASTQIMCADISSLVFSSSSSLVSFPVLWRYDIVQKVTNYRQQIPHWIWTTPMRYCRVSTSSSKRNDDCYIWFGSVDGVLRAVKDETGTSKEEEVTITVPSFASKIPFGGGISQNVLQVSSASSMKSSILSIANSGSMLVVDISNSQKEFSETKIITNAGASTPKDEVLFSAKASDDLVVVVTKGCVITLLKITETNSVSVVETSDEFEKQKSAKETCTSVRLMNHRFVYGDDFPMLLTLGTSQGRIGIFELAILPRMMKSTDSGLRNTCGDEVGHNDQSTSTATATTTTTTSTDLLVAARTAEEKDSTMIMIVALVVLMAAVVMLMKSSTSSKR